MKKAPQILECTLRDGSYSINFQFTAKQTSVLCQTLEEAGLGLIEVGHGVGIGASKKGLGQAAATDEAYLQAAKQVCSKSKIGMFCIPGIAEVSDLKNLSSIGLGFVRIGTNVTEVEKSRPFVEEAKKLGLTVMSNFMKSYIMNPADFAKQAAKSASYGADYVYIVDSAGGMLPDELKGYIQAVQDSTKVGLAFHGHNNLGLAVSNTFLATQMGVQIVDCTLQGLGRSSGNAPTEQMVALFRRQGLETPVDLIKIMDASDQLVRPLWPASGIDSLDVASGLAQFHSSYMGAIRKISTKYKVDPRRLILALCEKDRLNAPEDLLENLALEVSKKYGSRIWEEGRWNKYFGNEQN